MKKSFTNLENTHTLVFDYSDTDETPIVVNFYAYQIVGVIDPGINEDEDDYPEIYVYDDDITDIEKATPFAHGYVKWDGCVQIELSQHLCGWNRNIEYLIRDLYLQAATILAPGNIDGLSDLKAYYNITT